MDDPNSYLNRVVELRGCLIPHWNAARQVIAREIYLGSPVITVEDSGVADPFSLPVKKAADTLLFDAHASALQRAKIVGQIIHASPLEYCLLDEGVGLRVFTTETFPLQIGELVEAVGFLQLGGTCPILQAAQMRKIAKAQLPQPIPVQPDDLANQKHDSTLVRITAMLVSDAIQQDERVLELQSGPHHFLARLEPDHASQKSLPPGCRLELTGVYSNTKEKQTGDNLDPFELLLNSDAEIKVLQHTPWWTIRHAIGIVLALAGGLGIALIWIMMLRRKVAQRTGQLRKEIEERQRMEQSRAMENERNRIAQELHDDLGSSITEISMLATRANGASAPDGKSRKYLDQMMQKAREMVTALDEIVWAMSPGHDSVASLVSYLCLHADRFLDLAGIIWKLDNVVEPSKRVISSHQRHQLFLVFKEALTNVVRHSGATKVRLEIALERDWLMLSIADNGRGFPAGDRMMEMSGVDNMRMRIEKLSGHFEISGQTDGGTTVRFSVPLNTQA
jgi:signal transduction histidine kinase